MDRSLGMVGIVLVAVVAGTMATTAQPRSRDQWLALAKSGFAVPAGATATGLLVEMQPLLASTDPGLRDEVAYAAAERWLLRERLVSPDEARRLMRLWLGGLEVGLGSAGDDRTYGRTFSALCLSLVAARDVATPFLTAAEAHELRDRLFDYLRREQDLRGFDPVQGWAHAVAHAADVVKFLARGRHWQPADLATLLGIVDGVFTRQGTVFVWGEPERLAAAVHAALRRPDADMASFEAWLGRGTAGHAALWAGGPLIDPRRFAAVENTKQTLRALVALLAMESAPPPPAAAALRAALAALSTMR